MNDRFFMESFWQRGANCAAVAFIKAILCRYGLRGGFRVKKMANGQQITTPGGSTLVIPEKEIDQINRKNQITFRQFTNPRKANTQQVVRRRVKIIFAVIVHAMMRKMSRAQAIHALTREGVDIRSFRHFLGIRMTPVRRLNKRSLKRIREMEALLLYNAGHIVVASVGYYDNNGHAEKLTDEIPLLIGEPASHWTQLL
jgi:hypothetical protein